MFKKIITMLLIGLFTIVPVLGGTGVVKAEENGIKVDVIINNGGTVTFGLPKVYVLADGERVAELPLNYSYSDKVYQCEFSDIDSGKEYTIEAVNSEITDEHRQYLYGLRKFNKWYYCSYDTEISGSAEEGFTVVNTLMTDIYGTVSFKDDNLPSEIKVNLLKEGEVIDSIITDASKNWEFDFGRHCKVNDDGTETIYNVSVEEIDGYYSRTLGYDIEIVPCSTITLTKELKGESKEKEFGVYILPNFESQHRLWLQKLNRRYPLGTALLGIRWADEFIKNAKKYDKISNSEPLYPVVSAVFDEEFVNSVMSKVNSGEVKNDADLTSEEYEKGFNLCKKCRDWFILEGEHKYDTTVQAAHVDPDALDREVMEKSNLLLSTSWLLFRFAPDKAGDSWGSDYLGEDGKVNNDELRELLANYPFESFQDYIDKVVRNNMYFYTTIKAGETKTVELPVENLYSLLIVENDYEDTREPEAIEIVKLDRVVYDGEDYSDVSFNNYEATLTNIGTPSPVNVSITGKKTLTGRNIKDGEFTFELKENSEVIEQTTNKGEDVIFPTITYTQDDIGTHTYTISEKKESLGGVEYDTHTETVTVEVSDNGDGTLKTDIKTDSDGVVFNNTYSASGKAIIGGKKTLSGKSMDNFTFVLKKGEEVVDEAINDGNGNFSFKELSFTLDDIGSHTYTVSEKNDGKGGVDYDTHTETIVVNVTDNGDGTLKVDVKTDNDGVAFNNNYSSSGKINFVGQKNLANKAMQEFSFELKEGEDTIETVKNGTDGKITFKTITYTLEDVGEHTYTISEVNDSKHGIAYDTHTETIKVNVTDNGDGTLTAIPVYDADGVVFNNTYSATGAFAIEGQKNITGTDMKTFTFILKDEAGNEYEATNDETGKFTFNGLTFSHKDAGKDFIYTITEKNDAQPNIIYDEHIEEVKIHVEDNSDGTLTITPEYDENGVVFNNKAEFDVIINKTDMDGNEIAGAEITVTGDNFEQSWVSKENETMDIKVGAGEYTLKEVNAPLGYIPVTTEIKFTVGNNGEVTINDTNVEPAGVVEYKDGVIILKNKAIETVIPEETEEKIEPQGESQTPTEEADKNIEQSITNETIPNENYQETQTPETGDKNIAPFIIAGVLAAAGIAITGVYLKKRKTI